MIFRLALLCALLGAANAGCDLVSIQYVPTSSTIVNPGDTIAYDVRVTNIAGCPLTGVSLSDIQSCASVPSSVNLAVGQTVSYSCSTIVSGPGTISGSVSATLTSTATAAFSVNTVTPSIDIRKGDEGFSDSQTVRKGGVASWTIVVTNTGGVDLISIAVSDPLTPACNRAIAFLAAGASETYSCSASSVQSSFQNVASVTAVSVIDNSVTVSDSDGANVVVINPAIDIRKNAEGNSDTQKVRCGGSSTLTWIISVQNTGDVELTNVVIADPLAPNCDRTYPSLAPGERKLYLCRLLNVQSDFTNTACATGAVSIGAPVQDCDNNIIDVVCPSFEIRKNAPGPDTSTVISGGIATFTISVINTGDVELTDVIVTDALLPACNGVVSSLAPGAEFKYTCQSLPVTTTFQNTACATAAACAGPRLAQKCDSAEVNLLLASIDIAKNGEGPDLQTVISGSAQQWTIVVTNNGQAPLQNVVVTDPTEPACSRTLGSLAVGQSSTYICVTNNVVSTLQNVASVRGETTGGTVVIDSDVSTVNVVNPLINIRKNAEGPDTQQIRSGGTASFLMVVENLGDITLTNVVVSDPLESSCDRIFASMAPGHRETYTCRSLALTQDLVNTACVSASFDASPNTVQNCDESTVDVINPAFTVSKSAVPSTIPVGTPATFSISVTNTGDVALTNVVVSDALVADCSRSFATLAVAQTQTYQCTSSALSADLNNIACAAADAPAGNRLTQVCDNALVTTLAPSIDVRINEEGFTDSQTIRRGATAQFVVVVTNTGQSDLQNVIVGTVAAPDCSRQFATLAANTAQTFSCSSFNVDSSFSLTTIASGEYTPGFSTSDSDGALVVVVNPQVTIAKNQPGPDVTALANAGDAASWLIVVTNTGDVELRNVVVTDVAETSCERTFASLAPAASESYSCTSPPVTASFTNTACVTADMPVNVGGLPLGISPTICDDSSVEVAFADVAVRKNEPGEDTQLYRRGADVSFEIEVRNAGTVDLFSVAVVDPITPSCERTIAVLAPGANVVYTCIAPAVPESFLNFMRVTANAVGFPPVTATDTSRITIISPEIKVELAQDGFDTVFVTPGQPAVLEVHVTNSGDVALENVVTSSSELADCARFLQPLAPGGEATIFCSVSSVSTTFVASVEVSATVAGSADTTPVVDSDNARIAPLGTLCDMGAAPSSLAFDFSDTTGGLRSVYVEVFHGTNLVVPVVVASLDSVGSTFTVVRAAGLSPSITFRVFASPNKLTLVGQVSITTDCSVPIDISDMYTAGSLTGFSATFTILGEMK